MVMGVVRLSLKPPDPKIPVGGRPSPSRVLRAGASWRSGCGVEGHCVAESIQFADVVADLAFGVVARGVVVRAEVDELGVGVGEQCPDDDEDGAADRDDGALLAASSGDAP